jgi:hypothetical protein
MAEPSVFKKARGCSLDLPGKQGPTSREQLWQWPAQIIGDTIADEAMKIRLLDNCKAS